MIRSNTALIVKYSSLGAKDWFEVNHWQTFNDHELKDAYISGLFERDGKVYAVIKDDQNELFQYNAYGFWNTNRRFIQVWNHNSIFFLFISIK